MKLVKMSLHIKCCISFDMIHYINFPLHCVIQTHLFSILVCETWHLCKMSPVYDRINRRYKVWIEQEDIFWAFWQKFSPVAVCYMMWCNHAAMYFKFIVWSTFSESHQVSSWSHLSHLIFQVIIHSSHTFHCTDLATCSVPYSTCLLLTSCCTMCTSFSFCRHLGISFFSLHFSCHCCPLLMHWLSGLYEIPFHCYLLGVVSFVK